MVGLVAPDATTARVAGRGRRAADVDTGTWHGDDGAPLQRRARLRRRRAGTAGGAAAQPGQCARRRRRGRRSRSTSPTSAPAPAPSCTICAPRRRCCAGRRVAAGVQLLLAPASLREQRQAEAEGTLQSLLDAGAALLPDRLRRLRRLRQPLRRRQPRHRQHRAQLPRPHGRAGRAGLPGLAGDGGRIGAARLRSPIRARCWHDARTASGASAPTSTPTSWRRAST